LDFATENKGGTIGLKSMGENSIQKNQRKEKENLPTTRKADSAQSKEHPNIRHVGKIRIVSGFSESVGKERKGSRGEKKKMGGKLKNTKTKTNFSTAIPTTSWGS